MANISFIHALSKSIEESTDGKKPLPRAGSTQMEIIKGNHGNIHLGRHAILLFLMKMKQKTQPRKIRGWGGFCTTGLPVLRSAADAAITAPCLNI
jgi:hypothetical protein